MNADGMIATATVTVHDPASDPFDRGLYLAGCRQVSTLHPDEQARVHGALEHARVTSTHGWTLSVATTVIEGVFPRTKPLPRYVGVLAITDPDGHREIVLDRIAFVTPERPDGNLTSNFGIGTLMTDWSARGERYLRLNGAQLAGYMHEQWGRVERLHALAANVLTNTTEPGTPFWQTPDAVHWFWFPDTATADPWLQHFDGDPKRAWEYHQAGVSALDARAWADAKIGSHHVNAWIDAGWSPAEAKTYRDAIARNTPNYPDDSPNSEGTHRDLWAKIAKDSGIAPANLVAAAEASLSVWELAGTTAEQWDTVHVMAALRRPA